VARADNRPRMGHALAMRTAPRTVPNLAGQRKPELPTSSTSKLVRAPRPLDAGRKRRRRAEASISIFCDGACQPVNPGGTASWGFVIVRRAQDSGIVGTGSGMSNNVAEFHAVVMALEWIARHRPPERLIRLHADSKLVVEQLSGRWRMRGGLYAAEYRKAAALVQTLRALGYRIEFIWVPRAQNRQADSLTKQALMAAAGG
jgi:ribonuclease HI